MQQYLNLLRHIMASGVEKVDRTGVGVHSVFGAEMRFDLTQGFPLLTTKKVHWKSVVHELLWFLRGDTNVHYLNEHGVTIWDEWADASGDLGPVYGKQWRRWRTPDGEVDQIADLIESIKVDPSSRRLIVSAWNVGELAHMALPPCHAFMQFYVAGGELSCKLTQRSADAFLGVPFNIASYALLLTMVAQQCDLRPRELIWSGGDCHIYHNHKEQVSLQLTRQPTSLPQLQVARHPPSIFDYTFDDFDIVGYHPQPGIKAPIAV